MNILSIKNISKTYYGKVPYKALDSINLSIEKGEFVAVMGPSGSGKSTLLNIISTIDKQSEGQVILNGQDTSKLEGEKLAEFRRKQLGFVFQNFNLIDTLTVGENIMLPLTLDGRNVKKMNRETKNISEFLGIDKILDRRTYEISGGQAQRCAIARAIINNPSLLLADEPTGNLDSKSTDDVLELFAKINKEQNVTTLMVTHEAYSASHSDRVVFIKDGCIYTEIKKSGTNSSFYNKILSVLSQIGGVR
ncbi:MULTISPECIES: ABC transporter ATP-binding protein [unclassified Clostridioides]|uniref:ABC transporter ATP-binding protein n=1 Tax=unclassified Clostridioides TaxID=2635829 RepID=UPI001D0F9DE4|nr:ABC transporter ATP-binding protein [Clostridioides sp. ES-S-0001-02]MCC0640176.1 ABC transporter ATP-binding protein [Clostridioides sp. ES-S-0049-03]MCC0655620.1 ABC transporter ATP-binding protein [Clostridioides sp. ES-S-0123-01]MCC0673300.1 ABC transporter ATP-binding protein [Clostridioides sp. ES-S-0145-01]MCC0674601.1 ABC transporter ATP-binding protein [Clostridioides sp. ES-W-0018-02]MCC0679124.1 ABC transporter ATP-binding protein [Clostridioides sp. ES-S-0005-03]MCC0694422.1 AB